LRENSANRRTDDDRAGEGIAEGEAMKVGFGDEGGVPGSADGGVDVASICGVAMIVDRVGISDKGVGSHPLRSDAR